MVKWLFREINDIIKEYIDTGQFTVAEGYKKDHSDDLVGGKYSLSIVILFMIVLLPISIIIDILSIPLNIFLFIILWFYKKINEKSR